jgi:4a-hydroxytetrahydrobiopterin dehydratase
MATTTATELAQRKCKPLAPGTPALDERRVSELLKAVPGWELRDNGKQIARTFKFKNYYETMAFVNAVAYIAHHQDHHPDLEVGYNTCVVQFSTHSVGGLSENDFIFAAKLNALTG